MADSTFPAARRLLYLLTMTVVCLLAWAIFIHHLDFDSMWWDEHFTWRISREGMLAAVQGTANDVHPPASYLWVWAWRTWMGGSDNLFVLRLSSAITSLLGVAAVYRLGRAWLRSHWAGLGAALFLASSGVFIFYARELRMYSLVTLFAIASGLALYRLVRGQRLGVPAYAAAIALMLYTFYLSAFLVVAQFAAVLLLYRQRLPQLFQAYALAFLAYVPWLPGLLSNFAVSRAQGKTQNALIAGPLPARMTSADAVADFWEVYSAQQTGLLLLLLALALALGFSQKRSADFRRGLLLAVLWFLGTISLFFGVSLVVPVFGLRFVIAILPGLALLVGAAAGLLPGRRVRLTALAVITLTGLLSHAQVFDSLTIKPPYRQLLTTVAEHFQPGDKIWYNLNTGARGSSLNLSAGYHREYDTPQLAPEYFVWNAPRDFEDVQKTPRVWDVRPYWIPMPDDIMAVLTAGRVETEAYIIRDYAVRLYEAPPADAPILRFGSWFAAKISPLQREAVRAGETLTLKTWWRVEQRPDLDYSYGLYLRSADGRVLAQVDDGLAWDEAPTSQWQPAPDFKLVILTFPLPAELPPGTYDLLLAVYHWANPERLPVTGAPGADLLPELAAARLARLTVKP